MFLLNKYIVGFAALLVGLHCIEIIVFITNSDPAVIMTSMRHKELLVKAASLIPPLTSSAHKGSCGRIAVVGGSFEYTGAPFYAAISTLRVGADLSFVFCSLDAALPIKSYSPELMVLPCLDSTQNLSKGLDRIPSIHTLVVGPGLGRDPKIFSSAKELIFTAWKLNKYVLLDADATFLLATDKDLQEKIKGTKTIVTPNKVEFDRIYKSVFGKAEDIALAFPDKLDKYWLDSEAVPVEHFSYPVINLARSLGITILMKGKIDIITDGSVVAFNDKFGSSRRCGGQGDILSGTLGVFLAWEGLSFHNGKHGAVLAGFAASNVVRKANERAFEKKKRSFVAPDMIEELGNSFEELFSFL